ncbi:CocE/NonD family hydrolase [Melghirimyces profundicolus]|uniref:CocE/NonD family hydrolase n=1 Tax=Melghirimyces profundicolus TaxID=1242148 RepID=UPI000D34B2D7
MKYKVADCCGENDVDSPGWEDPAGPGHHSAEDEGVVPTIFFSSPYYNTLGRGYKHERKTPWDETLTTTPEPWAPSEWYDEYFVPRGYAVAMLDMRGTRNSSGCQVYGGRELVYSVVVERKKKA